MLSSLNPQSSYLQDTGLDNGWLLVIFHLATSTASRLESLDILPRFIVVLWLELAKDDVLAIEPACDFRGDEELRAVSVWSGIGHREKSYFGVLAGEVLIGKLLTVDRLATGAVTAGEITTLKHESWDYAVEGRSSVSETLLASAESTEVLGSLGNDIIVEVEYDAAVLLLDLLSCLKLLVENWAFPGNVEEGLDSHVCD